MTASTLSGGHLLVRCLQNFGASVCFGVPGESYLDVLDALHDTAGSLDFILCRNEGGACFMAEAYGKLTGSPGLCLVTRGPGATNASIGVHTAMQNSSPLILLIGQVGTDLRDREAFQEINYQEFFGSIAKKVIDIEQVERVPELMARAWSTALSGRPGPVVVSLPENMLVSRTSVPACRAPRIPEPAPGASEIEEISSVLASASRPVVVVGGGVWSDAGRNALHGFVESNQLPLVTAFRFNDLLDNHSVCYVGDAGVAMMPGVKRALVEADVILVIGARLGEMTTAEYSLLSVPDPETCLIHAHPSDQELGKIYSPQIPVHAGPNQTAMALQLLRLPGARWQSWTQSLRQSYLDGFAIPTQSGAVDMASICASIQNRLPDDAIVTSGAGNFTAWPNKFLKYGAAQRLLAPQSGAMGYSLPAAISAKLTHPEKTVICFTGDGDFQMTCQELGTAKQSNVMPIVLILNNGSYGTIRMHQENHYPMRVSATDIVNPDFVAIARAYGFYAQKVEKTSEFEAAFESALVSPTGAVLELMISKEAITPLRSLSDIRKSATAPVN